MTALLSLETIHYTYPGRQRPVLNGADLSLEPGQCLGLTGDNGSGKSTLLHIACGLVVPEQGLVRYKGQPLATEKDFAAFRLKLGYLLQHSEDQLFCPTVLEDVAFGPLNQGRSKTEARKVAEETLDRLHVRHLSGQNGSGLSGGEKRMAAFAAVLSMQPELLFLDEPTNDLDGASRAILLQTLRDLALPAIVISHDWDYMAEVCTNFLQLRDGRVVPPNVDPHSHVHIHPAGGTRHSHLLK